MRWTYMPGSHQENGYCLVSGSFQTRNSGEVVRVKEFVIDETSGFGACDTVPFVQGGTNLNLGECKRYPTVDHIKQCYGVTSYSFNPYEFSRAENDAVLAAIKAKPVDTVTSFSILNVIEEKQDRLAHIALAHSALKPGGLAFFKVFRRKNTGVPDSGKTVDGEWFQANKSAEHYLSEVKAVFGRDHASIVNDDIGNTIVARR